MLSVINRFIELKYKKIIYPSYIRKLTFISTNKNTNSAIYAHVKYCPDFHKDFHSYSKDGQLAYLPLTMNG